MKENGRININTKEIISFCRRNIYFPIIYIIFLLYFVLVYFNGDTPISVFGDKMGNILVGEMFKLTKWTPDIKSSVVVTSKDNQGLGATAASIYIPQIMTFDKLGNLYVYDKGYGHVVKFIRNSTSCMKNLH